VLHRTRLDLADMAEHCVTLMGSRAAARRLQLTMHPPAEHAIVHADSVRVEQIITNLLSNAIQYTPQGGSIDVYVEIDNGDAVLRVRDNGKGIPPRC
jgi:two-component system CheB/CheR fusion protein